MLDNLLMDGQGKPASGQHTFIDLSKFRAGPSGKQRKLIPWYASLLIPVHVECDAKRRRCKADLNATLHMVPTA